MIKKPEHIPKTPGVYIFRDEKKRPLYIGKAGNLKSRLSFYFSRSPKPPRIERLVEEARSLEMIDTVSEIDALITEAEHIKKHAPKYNVLMRDDKNYFYVAVTKEDLPRIFLTHQPRKSVGGRAHENYIGPFTSGSALKLTLRMLRRVFPYCTCTEPHKRPCLNAEIGRCLGFCCLKNTAPTAEERRQYRKNVFSILSVLKGRGRTMMRDIRREMKTAAAKQEFERAAILRDQVLGLSEIFEHTHILSSAFRDIRVRNTSDMEQLLRQLLGYTGPIERIEGYDISNISGTEAVGSMVVATKRKKAPLPESDQVFTYYAADRQQYRQFRIRTVTGANDVAMHKEVLSRRFKHHEWPPPDIVVIDGGLPQLHAAIEAIAMYHSAGQDGKVLTPMDAIHKKPLITALAKRKEELYVEGRAEPIELQKQPENILHLFQNIRNESHRFAKRYHHKRREILFRKK